MVGQWRGVFTIPVTPFDAHGDVDVQSLERCVRMRGPGLVTLDDFDQHELDAILEDVSELFTLAPLTASNGRVPV